jgi:hypothetical protein
MFQHNKQSQERRGETASQTEQDQILNPPKHSGHQVTTETIKVLLSLA